MHYEDIKQKARKLRKNPTPAEAFMWKKVRKRQLGGFKFQRQFILRIQLLQSKHRYYIVDFYNSVNKLIIEIDGEIHLGQREKDQAREELFKQSGFFVMRFKNEQVLNHWDEVANSILSRIDQNKTA